MEQISILFRPVRQEVDGIIDICHFADQPIALTKEDRTRKQSVFHIPSLTIAGSRGRSQKFTMPSMCVAIRADQDRLAMAFND